VCGPIAGFCQTAALLHYAPDSHALEQRCAFDPRAWHDGVAGEGLLIVLTSIHWRESWKYGERAFRYCQHDIGHAIAALALAAATLGWRARVLRWPYDALATLAGVNRDDDFFEAEREEPACVLHIAPDSKRLGQVDPAPLLAGLERGTWTGRASQLSEDHVQWTFIDEIAEATRACEWRECREEREGLDGREALKDFDGRDGPNGVARERRSARALFLQRRSAVGFDGQTRMSARTFHALLDRLQPRSAVPWSALWWEPRVHLVLFVHRVEDVAAGLYVMSRSERGGERLEAALGRGFSREPVADDLRLVRLAAGDCRSRAQRLSCDQDIAADGCFSVAMLADFDDALACEGPAFYRQLFWECGVIGQVLYLEAESAGVRGTGIGCFYDDAVHDALGVEGHQLQSLYHFTVGGPVEDRRISVEPGYGWEQGRRHSEAGVSTQD
jgi:nitroreductase